LVEEPFDFQTGFTELPMGLVEDLLSQSSKLAEHIRKQIQEMEQVKKEVREQLKREGVLRRDGDFGYYDVPTSCGVDGAYATERLLALDFGVAAAVAVEVSYRPPQEVIGQTLNTRLMLMLMHTVTTPQ